MVLDLRLKINIKGCREAAFNIYVALEACYKARIMVNAFDINHLFPIGLLRMPTVLAYYNPRHLALGFGVEGY